MRVSQMVGVAGTMTLIEYPFDCVDGLRGMLAGNTAISVLLEVYYDVWRSADIENTIHVCRSRNVRVFCLKLSNFDRRSIR